MYLSVPEPILAETLNRPVDILDAISLRQDHTDAMCCSPSAAVI